MTTDTALRENLAPGIEIPIIGKMGPEILEKTANRIKVKMPLEPNINHVGIMYAGSLFTLAEFPVGELIVQHLDLTKVFPVVASVNIKFLKPAATDIYATFEFKEGVLEGMQAEALESGKSVLDHSQELLDENGVVVAVTEARYMCLPIRS